MDIPRALRNELNALSKEVFGASSRWHTLLTRGTSQVVTRKSLETIPGKDGEEPTTKEVDVPVLTKQGTKQSVIKRYSLEEIHELLLNAKKQRDEIMAQIKQQQAEQAAAKAQEEAIKRVSEEARGSAV